MKMNNRTKWGWTVGVVAVMTLLASPGMSDQKKEESRQGMGDMQSMNQMMGECQKHQQAMMTSIDQMTKMMQQAKQSNNPAKMRDALDESQRPLMDMKERMTMCTNMMNMMQNMSGSVGGQMGGMMQGGSGGEMQGMMAEKQDQKPGAKKSSMMGGRGMGEKDVTCPMCIVEMILLGLLILAAIAALIALTIFLLRRSRRPA